MAFTKFGLDESILRAVKKAGYTQPTPVQAVSIPKVMQGGDVVAIAQTGTGKTAAFVLPILHRLVLQKKDARSEGTKALILVPTRELAVQIVENIESYGRYFQPRVAAIYGGVDETSQLRAARRGVDIIVATPGRLLDFIERQKADFSSLDVLVLDEADRMLHMGFLPDIEKVVEALPRRRQTLMFSATFPREVESLAKQFLYKPERVQVGRKLSPADTVKQSVYEVPQHLKAAMLQELLKSPKFRRVLVFVRMKDGVDRLTQFLKERGVKAEKLHSSRSQEQRLKALQAFKDGEIDVLVATDIVARGIDIEGVSHVVNYDFPVNTEDYVHRIGRTGRAEHEGEAISFVPKGDFNLLGITEMAIGQRLKRKRLRNFDYHAKTSALPDTGKPMKRDWRKRTREMEAKQAWVPKKQARKQVRKQAKKQARKRPNKRDL